MFVGGMVIVGVSGLVHSCLVAFVGSVVGVLPWLGGCSIWRLQQQLLQLWLLLLWGLVG